MNIYLATSLFVVLLCAISHQAASQDLVTNSPVEDTTTTAVEDIEDTTAVEVTTAVEDRTAVEVTTAATSRDNKYKQRRVCSGKGPNKVCREMECKVTKVYKKKRANNGERFCRRLKCKTDNGTKIVKTCRKTAFPPM